mmetsp:Transcript_31708/g.82834  ORF Transcript_31708/g.82834 Transcript_31708/m.82834 type:complete len:227 (+) Transcript_31708:61-741(+)
MSSYRSAAEVFSSTQSLDAWNPRAGAHRVSAVAPAGSRASASATGVELSASRAASGKPGATVARAAARRSSPAPMRRERSDSPSIWRDAVVRASSSEMKALTASTTVDAGGGVAVTPSSCSCTRGPSSSRKSLAVLRTRSSSAAGARSCTRASGGCKPSGPTTLAGASMRAERSAWRVAASTPTTNSSMRMSCSVDPSGERRRLANSRAASAWPAPSISTSAVAAV